MDWRSIDLNLLVVFQAILEHRSVTRAGESLGLSQPAMSACLARLRSLMDDPLFVRSGMEMIPTPRAQAVAAPVRRALASIETEVLQRTVFDPATTDKTFTLVTPDIGELIFLPNLLANFALQAPGASIQTFSRPPSTASEALESGEAELAVGYFPDLHRAGFFRQKLADDSIVCLVRKDHPYMGAGLTMQEYLSASHAVVRPDGRGQDVNQSLAAGGKQRRVVVEVSNFMSLLSIISSSDLVAAVPRALARHCASYAKFRTMELPFRTPTIPVHQFWHERFNKDPSHIWLRRIICSIDFGASPGAT